MKHIEIFTFCLLLSFSLFSSQSNQIPILNDLATLQVKVDNTEITNNNQVQTTFEILFKANLGKVSPGSPFPQILKDSLIIIKYNADEANIISINCKKNSIIECRLKDDFIEIKAKYSTNFLYLRETFQTSSNKQVSIISFTYKSA